MTTFDRLMAAAPKILVWIAALIFVLAFVGGLLFRLSHPSSFGLPSDIIFALSNAFQDAFWPFVGAAAVWRMDRPFKIVRAEAAE